MLYIRYPLSLRQVEDLLFERGIDICHETVRFWWNRFGPMFAAEIRRRRVHSEFLIGPEILVKCVRVQTTAAYLSTCPGRINCLARETQKTQDICGNRGFEESTPEQ